MWATGTSSSTVAEALNNNSTITIVGYNDTTAHAIRWVRQPGDWAHADLFNVTSRGCGDIEKALDVNDYAEPWIAASGTNASGDRGFVLIPLGPCPYDLNGDGVVDVQDLVLLILSWGPCQPAKLCPTDGNGDCTVDVQDQIDMIIAWGACPSGFAGPEGPQGPAGPESASSPPPCVLATLELFNADPTPQMAELCAALLQQCGGE